MSTHLAAASCVWRRQRLRLPTSTASPRRGSGRPPPPSCVRCADSWARIGAAIAFGEACDRRFRVDEIVDVLRSRADLCAIALAACPTTPARRDRRSTASTVGSFGRQECVFRRFPPPRRSRTSSIVDRALGPVEWPNREGATTPPESWVRGVAGCPAPTAPFDRCGPRAELTDGVGIDGFAVTHHRRTRLWAVSSSWSNTGRAGRVSS